MFKAKSKIRGVAQDFGFLYIALQDSPYITVYDSKTFAKHDSVFLDGLQNPWDMIVVVGSIYVSEQRKSTIMHTYAGESTIYKWDVVGPSATLSATPEGNILASFTSPRDKRRLVEYTQRGGVVREICLDRQGISPSHAVKLRSGKFVVCDGTDKQHRVALLNQDGEIIRTTRPYGKQNKPRCLVRDHLDRILVADPNSNVFIIFNCELKEVTSFVLPGLDSNKLVRICWDEERGILYALEEKHRNVLMVTGLSKVVDELLN